MTFSDLLRLLRHYLKIAIAIPIACAVITVVVTLLAPSTYEAKATLITDADIALTGGFAQSEAELFSQNGITVTSKADTAYRTITIFAEGSDYNGCISAANSAINATADEIRKVNPAFTITTNEATYAERISPGLLKLIAIALVLGVFLSICALIVIDAIKKPIKSENDIVTLFDLPIIGRIPNRDRGEKLLANIRFLSEEPLNTIAVIPAGLTGATLTCAELTSVFEHSGVAVSRTKGNPHAEGFKSAALPGILTIVECPSLSEGIGSVYIAKEADITILCVREWLDSRSALSNMIDELHLAKANIIGVVYLATK